MLNIHMIGHGHIDPVWLWRWQEGFEEIRATFRSALDRMNETPQFRFTASSACFYAWVKQCDPAMFEEIRARVHEGRWETAGGWWIEPDCNIPLGESFLRQGLHGQRFFTREFGRPAAVGFNPDSFGHAGTLPQILAAQGLCYYIYMRPNPGHDGGERAYPGGTTFLWRAPDGSEVLASVIQESYNSADGTPECLDYLLHCPHLNPGQQHVMGFFGVGNHGGGPTRRAIAAILEAQRKPEPRVEFSTLERYLRAFEQAHPRETLAVETDELQHHARGCYSAHSGVKSWMRRAEHALLNAERIAVLAGQVCEMEYPYKTLDAAWKTLLFNQFHDILAGSSIEAAYDDARDQLGAVNHAANTIINTAAQMIAREMDTSAGGNSVALFNPLPWSVRACITPSPLARRALGDAIEVLDPGGNRVTHQPVLGPHTGSRTLCFHADLPALGHAVYTVRNAEETHLAETTLQTGAHSIENRWWRIEIDPSEGCISRLFDKTRQIDLLMNGARLLCIEDPSDTWSHRVTRYSGAVSHFGGAAVDTLESGPVRATLRIQSAHGASTAQLLLTLYDAAPDIDLRCRVNWQEHYTMLKLGFDTNIDAPRVTAECAYGAQARAANGEEEPMQQWVDLSGEINGAACGLAIINDCKYGYDCQGGHLRISCLRSPAYAHHDPHAYNPAEPFAIMDQGWHEMAFRLIPHAGDWRAADLPRLAWTFNSPPIVHIESAHPGRLPLRQGHFDCPAPNLLWTVLKQAEDAPGLILRGYETAGQETRASLSFMDCAYGISFRPHEIKTLRIYPAPGAATEYNALELDLISDSVVTEL